MRAFDADDGAILAAEVAGHIENGVTDVVDVEDAEAGTECSTWSPGL